MKKVLSAILAALFMLSFMTACGAENQVEKPQEQTISMQIGNPKMTVSGVEKDIDENGTTPVVVNDRTLLPVRAVVEEMGGDVSWDGETQTVTLTCGENEIQLVIDKNTALLNGKETELDTAPVVMNDRTMLPIRFIAESFGYTVSWDEETQTVTLTKKAAEETPAAQPAGETTAKALVVYYSATGSTKAVAEKIADKLNADIFVIEPSEPYESADLNYNDSNSRVSKEHDNEALRKVDLKVTTPENWEQYDTVYVGYPIWWGIAAWSVSSFVSENDFAGKMVIPFCTSASSGLGQSGKLLSDAAKGGTWKDGKRFSGSASESEIASWLDSMK